MIMLTKLDNSPVLVNIEGIKYIESTPDTLIRYLNGDTMIVRESLEDIERRVLELKQRIFNEQASQ